MWHERVRSGPMSLMTSTTGLGAASTASHNRSSPRSSQRDAVVLSAVQVTAYPSIVSRSGKAHRSSQPAKPSRRPRTPSRSMAFEIVGLSICRSASRSSAVRRDKRPSRFWGGRIVHFALRGPRQLKVEQVSTLNSPTADGVPDREGYRVVVNAGGRGAPTVLVLGADARGMLFGVGRLLRELRMTRGSVQVPATLSIVSTPQVALRGHQLGYRPKTNAYDAWDVPMWEQYLRDLAIFGSNAIELIPPRSDDAPDSPHF